MTLSTGASRSQRLFERAQQSLPGGVNSPVRAFRSVGGEPLFIERGQGCRITSADGREYIDFVASWGPLIAGHAHPKVVEAVNLTASKGTSFGAPCELEVLLAEKVRAFFPSLDLVRFVNSGTEATMSALRLARGFTGRNKIVKFAGCYHGHADSLLVESGSGAATLGIPGSAGVTPGAAQDTLTLPFNDEQAFRSLMESQGERIAAVIVEPVAGNMGVIPPEDGYLQALREVTETSGTVLIFDEVMTGWRVSRGGAQGRYGVTPDLTCLGKVLGGGFPVGAYGGRREIMERIAPMGPVYQAGTLSGNPVAMAAGLATLELLEDPATFDALEQRAVRMEEGLRAGCAAVDVPTRLQRAGTMSCLFFHDGPVRNYDEARQCDTEAFGRYFLAMLSEGIYLAPSQFEASFIGLAHGDEEIETTIDAHRRALEAAARG